MLIAVLFLLSGCAGLGTGSSSNRDKGRADAFLRLGASYLRQGQTTPALRELLKAEQLDPDNPEIQNHLGLTYMAKKRYPLAVERFGGWGFS